MTEAMTVSRGYARGQMPSLLDELGDVRVQGGKTGIEGDESSSASSGKFGQIGVGDLAMSDNAFPVRVAEGQVVGPELVAGIGDDASEDAQGRSDTKVGPAAERQPYESALCDRTGRKPCDLGSCEPLCASVICGVVREGESDEHAWVE